MEIKSINEIKKEAFIYCNYMNKFNISDFRTWLFKLKIPTFFIKFKKYLKKDINKALFYLYCAENYENTSKIIKRYICLAKEEYFSNYRTYLEIELEDENNYQDENLFKILFEEIEFEDLKEMYLENLKLIKIKSNLNEESLLGNFIEFEASVFKNNLSKRLKYEINLFYENYFKTRIEKINKLIASRKSIYEMIMELEKFVFLDKISNISLSQYSNLLKSLKEEKKFMESLKFNFTLTEFILAKNEILNFYETKEKVEILNVIEKNILELTEKTFLEIEEKLYFFESDSLIENINFYKEMYSKVKNIKNKYFDIFYKIEKRYNYLKSKFDKINEIKKGMNSLEFEENYSLHLKMIDLYESFVPEFKEEMIIKLDLEKSIDSYKQFYHSKSIEKIKKLKLKLESNEFSTYKSFLDYINEISFSDKSIFKTLIDMINKNEELIDLELKKYENFYSKSYNELEKLYLKKEEFFIYFDEHILLSMKLKEKKEKIYEILKRKLNEELEKVLQNKESSFFMEKLKFIENKFRILNYIPENFELFKMNLKNK